MIRNNMCALKFQTAVNGNVTAVLFDLFFVLITLLGCNVLRTRCGSDETDVASPS